MPRFSIAWLLLITAVVASVVCAIVASINNVNLKREVEELRFSEQEASDRNKSLEKTRDKLVNKLYQSGFGTALIAQLSRDAELNRTLLDQMASVTTESMRCTMRTFPDMPQVRLLIFEEAVLQNGPSVSRLFNSAPKPKHRPAVCVLTNQDDNGILDSVCHKGTGGLSYIYSNPWLIGWEQPDGTVIEYHVTEAGFQRVR